MRSGFSVFFDLRFGEIEAASQSSMKIFLAWNLGLKRRFAWNPVSFRWLLSGRSDRSIISARLGSAGSVY